MKYRLTYTAFWVFLLLASAVISAEEPIVNFYNWADYIGVTTIADFEAETGIRVNYDIYDSSEMVDTKLLAGSTSYDIVIHAASYTSRLIPIGVMQPLDKSRLPNWKNLDPRILKTLEQYDPGLRYGVPYMWGTTGFTYNVRMIRERLPDAPVGSAGMIFRPEIVSRFADCGVSLLDSPIDLIPMALIYLGHDSNSINPLELLEAENMLFAIRPYISYFSNAKVLIDIPTGEVCVAMSWSGDYSVAKRRAAEAGIDLELAYNMPKEGMPAWFDAAFIPADAPHPDNAHIFLNYLLRPQVIADITNYTGYGNANRAATALVDEEIRNDPAIYPDEAVLARLHPTRILWPKMERIRTRVMSRVKSGVR